MKTQITKEGITVKVRRLTYSAARGDERITIDVFDDSSHEITNVRVLPNSDLPEKALKILYNGLRIKQ